MAGEIVHDDHVAGPELRHEHLVDIGLEGMPVEWTIKHHGSCDPVVAQPRHEGSGLPMAVRDPGSQALALRRPAAQPGMLVEVHVSSINTSRAGSRSSWPSNHSSLRLRTSGRSCSDAWAVFF